MKFPWPLLLLCTLSFMGGSTLAWLFTGETDFGLGLVVGSGMGVAAGVANTWLHYRVTGPGQPEPGEVEDSCGGIPF